MRIGDGSSYVCSSDLERLQSRMEIEHVFDQKRIALNETPTDNYTLVNASISFKPLPGNGTTLVLSANNIFDVVARRHASFLKDYAPLAGRDFRISTRFAFRSEEHTSELQSLMRISYAVFCLK